MPARCAAAELATLVDEQINEGARLEFADATSALQETGDMDQGSAYLVAGEMYFTPKSVNCGICRGTAKLCRDGAVEADGCVVSGSCEMEWAKRYPDNYRADDGGAPADPLICSAEIGCSALIAMVSVDGDGRLVPNLTRGVCELADRGDNWVSRREDAVQSEMLVAPEAGIQAFDGAGSGREE